MLRCCAGDQGWSMMLINDRRRRVLLSSECHLQSRAYREGSNAGFDGTVCRKRPRQAWPAHCRNSQHQDPGPRWSSRVSGQWSSWNDVFIVCFDRAKDPAHVPEILESCPSRHRCKGKRARSKLCTGQQRLYRKRS